jgi:hypothetical protein
MTMFDRVKCWIGWHSPEVKTEYLGRVGFDVLRFASGRMEPYSKEL